MINPNYVDGLELKIKELAAERDAALVQNTEFEQRINQFVDLQNTRDDLERQNAELVAQVELLRKLGLKVIRQCSRKEDYSAEVEDFDNALYLKPAQCLRQIQADAVLDAVNSCVVVECFGTKCISVRGLVGYAARVKAGEA